MNKRIWKLAVFTAALALCAAMFAVSSFAARLPGDMNKDGKVNSADARIVLRIAARLESVEDYMDDEPEPTAPPTTEAPTTEAPTTAAPTEPVIVNLALDYSITDDGYFIGGESVATIAVTSDGDIDGAELRIENAAGTVYFTSALGSLKKDAAATVEWDGKGADGSFAPSGDYTIVVTAGENTAKLEGLTFTAENPFKDGNGSEANPFPVASKEDFENIVRYPRGYFKQTQDIEYNLEGAKSIFTADAQFNGVYDGNGKTISNILSTNPMIDYVGKDGVVKNVTVKDSSFSCQSGLVWYNNGTIENCNINANITLTRSAETTMGIICSVNNGLILNSSAQGIAKGSTGESDTNCFVGGITGINAGKIVSCIAEVDVSSYGTDHWSNGRQSLSGGISGKNETSGFIQNSEAKGSISNNRKTTGGIAGANYGQITKCIYTGDSDVNLSGGGSGIVA